MCRSADHGDPRPNQGTYITDSASIAPEMLQKRTQKDCESQNIETAVQPSPNDHMEKARTMAKSKDI